MDGSLKPICIRNVSVILRNVCLATKTPEVSRVRRESRNKMADDQSFAAAEYDKFQQCYGRLMNFTYKEEESSKTNLNLLLDELNSVEYSLSIVNEEVRVCTSCYLSFSEFVFACHLFSSLNHY
jgi:hypothetical protein